MSLPIHAAQPPLTVVLDTETTGRGPQDHRDDGIVQIGLAWRDPRTGALATWSEDCDPGARLYAHGRADAAFKINGMTLDRLARARPATLVADALRERLAALQRDAGRPLDLRTYNLGFDRPFLEADPWRLRGPWGPCLMLDAHRRLDPRGKWPRLAAALRAYGLDHPGPAHDAAGDAHAALLLHEAMLRQDPVARVPLR